jgi:hypothetical protein
MRFKYETQVSKRLRSRAQVKGSFAQPPQNGRWSLTPIYLLVYVTAATSCINVRIKG